MAINYPNLFIPGAAKSGTSTLHEILNTHPEICMSSIKEPFFWVNQNFTSFSQINWENYLELFNKKKNVKYRGESSTGYMLFSEFLERIKVLDTENLKFIFILRNPIDRIYSHYWYLKGLGSESLDLKSAVLCDIDIEPDITKCLPEGKYKHYFQYGLYGKWLSKFYSCFKPEQIEIVIFEELKNNSLLVANDCFKFLGLKELNQIPDIYANETVLLKYPILYKRIMKFSNLIKEMFRPTFKYFPRNLKQLIKNINLSEMIIKKTKSNQKVPKISDIDRAWLIDLYQKDVRLLKNLTGLEFEPWEDFK